MQLSLPSPAAAIASAADDAALKSRLEARTRGTPVIIPYAAAVTALAALSARRVALVSPPWFSADMDQQGVDYFQRQALEVVYSGPADLPSDQQAIEPEQLYDWVRSHVPPSADSVFVGGNGFRAIGVIQALEDSLGRPVLTANQVAFWCALRLAGARVPVINYGRIFGVDLPPS